MMKVLVLDGAGMVGHAISIHFKEAGHDVTAMSHSRINYCNNINSDITNFENFKKIVDQGQYDAIINAVGILNQDAEENKPTAVLLNSYLPHFISEITKGTKTRIIHMSTDCVFSGEIGNYSETSFRDGESFYSRTKALGELQNTKDLTIRTSKIGPDINEMGIGLFNWFMKNNGQINGFTKAIWTGVTTLTLAKAIEQALKENITGLYNLVNNEAIRKYELLKLFNKHMKENRIDISPSDKLSLDKSLINTRTDFSFKVPGYETMIVEMKEWIDNHKDLYPHYFI